MLEEIANDTYERASAKNEPLFDPSIDYQNIVKMRNDLAKHWASMNATERSEYKDLSEFQARSGAQDPRDISLVPAKNYSLVRAEVEKKIQSSNIILPLAIDAIDFGQSLTEIAESLENAQEIREIYKIRKLTTGTEKNSGINTEEAQKIKNCFTQGRELFLSGQNGSLMVKPLNLFYALTAYSYGIIILNNPLRFRKDMLPGSHGMGYLPQTIQAQFGGDMPRGTFSDLFSSFPVHHIRVKDYEFYIDCTNSLIEFQNTRFSVSLGTLMSMIPEVAPYYYLTTGRRSRCYPLDIATAGDPRQVIWELAIGDGEHRPSAKSIADAFLGFSTSERHGKIIVQVPAVSAHKIMACIYTDIRGQLWFIENPFFPVILPEIAVHFLASSIFSNIMRYRPDEWGNVLLNEVPSSISLLSRHYISSLQRKFLVLVLRSISRYMPYAA